MPLAELMAAIQGVPALSGTAEMVSVKLPVTRQPLGLAAGLWAGIVSTLCSPAAAQGEPTQL